MRSNRSAVVPILRSQHMAELLAYLLLRSSDEFTISSLVDELRIPLTTVSDEVKRLTESGLLRSRKIGRTRLVSANTEHPLARPLSEMLFTAFGPYMVVGEEFSVVRGAQKVCVFGTWAQRYNGVPGPLPDEIDVLVIGDGVSERETFDAADRVQQRIHMPVNATICTPEQWTDPDDGTLLAQIRSGPYTTVYGALRRPDVASR